MNDEQYATIVRMFTTLSEQIQTLRQDMNAGFARVTQEFANVRQENAEEFANIRQEIAEEFASVRQEMTNGLERQEGISHTILEAISGPFEALEKETRTTKRSHARRLNKIERHLGIV